MRVIKYITLALLLTASLTAGAKNVKVPHVYMFGFAASFQDSVIYMTDIQDVQGAWMDTKSKFLLGRDNYSYQLKNHLETQGLLQRVCVVFFAKNRKKAEKMYVKLRKKYLPATKKKKSKKRQEPALYDIRYITAQDFSFEPVDMSE